jgi:hypothetical protein
MEEDEQVRVLMAGFRGSNLDASDFAASDVTMRLVDLGSMEEGDEEVRCRWLVVEGGGGGGGSDCWEPVNVQPQSTTATAQVPLLLLWRWRWVLVLGLPPPCDLPQPQGSCRVMARASPRQVQCCCRKLLLCRADLSPSLFGTAKP